MTTYVIGDVQGCFTELKRLLDVIQFNPRADKLWFTGDIVNRGPHSLETLRFIKNLSAKAQMVLGNHDLHLLALAHGLHPGSSDDTLLPILQAADRDELLGWLVQQPLLFHDEELGFTLVHAGLAPSWDLAIAASLAKEVEKMLCSDQSHEYFQHMYGNTPNYWDDALQGYDRLRSITNYFTRARFCFADGSLDFLTKENVTTHRKDLVPWFALPQRVNKDLKIVFGHWAALGGVTNTPNVFALDTGCVWGGELTAMRLPDGKRFSVRKN